MKNAFHLSLPCLNIEKTRSFYIDKLGAELGRFAHNWIDIDLFEHQITFTQCKKFHFDYPQYSFEGKVLPSFHFGIITEPELWNSLYQRLSANLPAGLEKTSFLRNEPGEHRTFFVKDPNGYIIEFKCFREQGQTFSRKD